MYDQQAPFYPTVFENKQYQQQMLQVKSVKNNYSPATVSSLSSSPEAYSTDIDLQFSCENLSAAFSQASLNTPYDPNCLESLDEFLDELDDMQEYETPSAETILFFEILQEFPDLATFIGHKDFGIFAHLWLDLQQNIRLAKEPSQRPVVQSWLKNAALQIHFLLVTIVKTNHGNKDLKSEPRCMFSAFRRLKDRIEIMYQVFELIENGRVWFNQTPLEAIAPLSNSAKMIAKDIMYFEKNPEILPLVDPSNGRVELVNAKEVTMEDLSMRVLHSYNMPFIFDSASAKSLIVQLNQQETTNGRSLSLPSLQQDLPAFSASESIPTQNSHLDFHAQQNFVRGESNPTTPFSHIQPAWIHSSGVWSMPVTPYASTRTQEEATIASTVNTPCNIIQGSSLSLNSTTTITPLNTFSEGNTDDEFSVCIKDDEDYVVSDPEDEDWKESSPPRRRSKRAIAATVVAATVTDPKTSFGQDLHKVKSQKPRRRATERQFTRRTATSYDSHTTHYLKSVFFDIYSSRDKLTKEQRRRVQKDTGLKPRNITYWFSNHKRRFQASLAVYKKVVKESQGMVKSYDDFLNWRRSRGLPDEVLDKEAIGLDLILTKQHQQ